MFRTCQNGSKPAGRRQTDILCSWRMHMARCWQRWMRRFRGRSLFRRCRHRMATFTSATKTPANVFDKVNHREPSENPREVGKENLVPTHRKNDKSRQMELTPSRMVRRISRSRRCEGRRGVLRGPIAPASPRCARSDAWRLKVERPLQRESSSRCHSSARIDSS